MGGGQGEEEETLAVMQAAVAVIAVEAVELVERALSPLAVVASAF